MDTFRQSRGRKVVARDSARQLGTVNHLLVDVAARQVSAIVLGAGRHARLVDWAGVTGFGSDAVMVADEAALRSPVDDRERAGADGKLELVGKRTLTERGNELGALDDVTFDPASGAVVTLQIGDRAIPASSLFGSGHYAVVVDAGQEPAD